MKTPTISVIIPTWNSEKTVLHAIKSCLNQTLPPFEVLVCDDGSTDNSEVLVKQIQDKRVVWIAGDHSGIPAMVRNKGIKVSQGEWIAFCDSDDEWLPRKLEKQFYEMISSGLLASSTNALRRTRGFILGKYLKRKKRTISFKDLLNVNDVICSTAIIHSSIPKKIGGFPEERTYRGFEDYAYWLRISTKTDFVYIDEPMAIYNDYPIISIRATNPTDAVIKQVTIENFKNWSRTSKLPMYYNFCITFFLYKKRVKESIKHLYKKHD